MSFFKKNFVKINPKGIDPTKLSPAFSLTKNQNYFFTHGDSDLRVLTHHFDYFKKFFHQLMMNALHKLSLSSFQSKNCDLELAVFWGQIVRISFRRPAPMTESNWRSCGDRWRPTQEGLPGLNFGAA